MAHIYEKRDFYTAAINELQQGDYPELSARLAAGEDNKHIAWLASGGIMGDRS